jgi:Fe-S-cluster-containing dehydrogenase component
MKTKRQIIKIDEDLCDGCEQCIPACPEGALQIVAGVAKLVREGYCDGLGACLGECPRGALTVEEREVDEYDEGGVIEHLKTNAPERLGDHMMHLSEHGMAPSGLSACPSSRTMHWGDPGEGDRSSAEGASGGGEPTVPLSSELRQWPIQLHLVNPLAPYFKDADLVLVADCVPFAYANFHNDLLKGKAVAIACPKLDDTRPYVSKLVRMIDHANLKSLKVIVMEVPCCSGLIGMAREAIGQAARPIPIESVVIGVKGELRG